MIIIMLITNSQPSCNYIWFKIYRSPFSCWRRTNHECAYSYLYDVFCCCDLDLDIRAWPKYSEDDLHTSAKMKFLGQGFQKLEHEQADRRTYRQTDATERITNHIRGWQQNES